MAASVARLSLYALITAIEEDLRESLIRFLPDDGNAIGLLGPQLFAKLADRREAEAAQESPEGTLEDLLHYSDYGDAIQLARKHSSKLPEQLVGQLKQLDDALTSLIRIRNRVMHSRPLEYDDLATTTDLCERLLKSNVYWSRLKEIRQRLSTEPDLLLKLSIPFERDESTISHNLPLPDFDETGFIGRSSIVKGLTKAINGIYPVITIVGEGGLGKTSLALKVAYDLLDQSDAKFDAIIFVSAKTQKLTENEIQRLKGAINSSVGLIESAANELGGAQSKSLDDLIELMSQFQVLLIIDNLETVLDQNIKELMERLPSGSKVLITTRIRMGAFEYPVQLEPLSTNEATQLLRATAKARECGRLVAMSDSKLQDYCKRMRNSPLHIKWFVSAVQAGQRPEAVLADERLFLQFCLSNVFNVISDDGRKLVRTLLSLGGSYTVAELAFLTSMDQTTLLKAIGELTRTNMFFAVSKPTEVSFETKYELSQLARAYLSRFYPVNREEQQKLLLHKQKLVSAGEQIQSDAEQDPLSASSIHCRTRSDWVIAKYLRDALTRIRGDHIDEAFRLIEEAKSLAPDFSEVHRVEAFAFARSGNMTSAYDSYERAIEFAPNSAVTRMLFGGFLLRDVHDTDSALEQFRAAALLCPERPEPKIELARASIYVRRFDDAKEVIAELENDPPKHELLAKKVADVHLQLFTRSADHYSINHEPIRALDALEETRSFYSNIANPDERMRARIGKLSRTAAQIRNQFNDDPSRQSRAVELLAWIEEISRTPVVEAAPSQSIALGLRSNGRIKLIHHTGRFGFITQDDGRELFFHDNYIKGRASDFEPGQPVDFEVTIDWRGRIVAAKVRPRHA